MATIKPIEGRTVHQIQSGQVIVDLCSVVKELVENSLDAGATSIDVRFRNQGLESIEVQDNGDGISPHNYESLALKHYTSKLSTYADLTTLQTFGFRGEALSSLCALSKFSVITCLAEDAPKGTRLEFETSGKLMGTSVVAAQKGTTILVENLFNNLPVRRRELERKIKTEWTRVVGVLGQYACIQTGIKFSVTQQAGKGKKTILFSTKGNQTTRENIVNVFGAKTLTALVTLDLNLELEPTSAPSQRWSTQEDGEKKEIRIVGHISRPASGEGRQTPDRQMFFVNSRPCGLPQVAKAFNEVYKQYNGHQSPFIFANIELDTHLYDVNVSPDKRTILLHDQNCMLENLKTALVELFESQDYTVPISQLPAQKTPSYKQLTISREASTPSKSPLTPGPARDEEKQDDDARSLKRAQSTDSEGPRNQHNLKTTASAVSRESMTKDQEPTSLISNWLSRNTQDRSNTEAKNQAPKPASKIPPKIPVGLSKEKLRLIGRLSKGSEEAQAVPDSPVAPESPFATSWSTHSPPLFIPPVLAADFNHSTTKSQGSESAEEEAEQDPEAVIPAVESPPKPPSSIAGRFSATPRSQRPPAEIAIITIGDQTISSSIGSPSRKRARIENLAGKTNSKSRSQGPSKVLPSFGESLSQRFAAPGTQSISIKEDEEGKEEEAGLDSPEPIEESDEPSAKELELDDDDDDDEETREDIPDIQSTPNIGKEQETVDSSTIPTGIEEEGEAMDEDQKKAHEEARVKEMIEQAENSAVIPSQENVKRAQSLVKGGWKKKDSTLNLIRNIDTTASKISEQLQELEKTMSTFQIAAAATAEDDALDSEKAEEKLSLTITKSDFAKMKIIGQFNLGFILASRASKSAAEDGAMIADDMFIIDQHASDEKYNFERLQATTIVQSQRLVSPRILDLTAMEEEIVIENLSALETNGFIVKVDESGESPVGQRCQLISLPLSRETAFSLTDLEELIALLSENPPGAVPRPSKVRKMFAMRACRSSIMIGKTLTQKQMGKVVSHLGELDKPWNCPHGRPTMRHLCGLRVWDDCGWKEDFEPEMGVTNWGGWVRDTRESSAEGEEGEGEEDVIEDDKPKGENMVDVDVEMGHEEQIET